MNECIFGTFMKCVLEIVLNLSIFVVVVVSQILKQRGPKQLCRINKQGS